MSRRHRTGCKGCCQPLHTSDGGRVIPSRTADLANISLPALKQCQCQIQDVNNAYSYVH